MKYLFLALGMSVAFLSLEKSDEHGRPAYALRTQASRNVSIVLGSNMSGSVASFNRTAILSTDLNTYTGFANSIKLLAGVFPDDDEMPDHLRLKNLEDQVGFDTIDSVYTLIMAVRNGYLNISEVTSEQMSEFYKVWYHYDRGPIALYLGLRPEVMLKHFIDCHVGFSSICRP